MADSSTKQEEEHFPVSEEQIKYFEENGYVVIENLIEENALMSYRHLYDKLINNEIESGHRRSDLGGHADKVLGEDSENITQIMWPSDLLPEFINCQYFKRALSVSKQLLKCDNVERDFDMLIYKAPKSQTIVPWHQDAAYWLDLPDKRAASCWLALDDTTVDNGCMWFVPKSHTGPVRKHKASGTGSHQGKGALECDCSESEGVPVPIKAGSCTFHAGSTLHYSRGNATDGKRRGFIANYRPKDMIEYERNNNFDHGRVDNTRKVRNVLAH